MTTPAWRPDAYAPRQPFLRERATITRAIRQFFHERDFVEAETPILQVSPGLEPHLKAFATTLETPRGETMPLHLHTSPEFAMKKLLVAGETRIFQLARVFRNGERSPTHHPEFTMLEWYRAQADYRAIMADTIDLVRVAAEAAGMTHLTWRGVACDPFAEWQIMTVAEAFDRFTGIDVLGTIENVPSPSAFGIGRRPLPLGRGECSLAAEARRIGVRVAEDDRWDDLFFRIFLERIEPELGKHAPAIVCEYPISMAALARPKPGDPAVAERFEVYVGGLELANAFGELTDAATQRRRFEADMDLKQELYGLRYPIDEDFLAALEHGMPESSGIALGIDRLVMLITGAASIDQVLWLPVAGG